MAWRKTTNGTNGSKKRQPVSADGRAQGGVSSSQWRMEMANGDQDDR